MIVVPATLTRQLDDGASVFAPYASGTPELAAHDYVEEEWIASGLEDGNPYSTVLNVRRPRDAARFSGGVVVEPQHLHGIAPVWLYTGEYLVRSGHAWVCVVAQKTTLDQHVRGPSPQRYVDLHIEGPDSSDFDSGVDLGDAEKMEQLWSELRHRNRAATSILAQVGAALRGPGGPLDDLAPTAVVLAGHSQTGSVTSYYLRDVHGSVRRPDGTAVYDGYFPSGFPYEPFHDIDVPVVQVMSEGDVAVPGFSFRPGYGDRRYRRADSDEPGDRFRLYELAGVPHMGTRIAPFDDPTLWAATFPNDDVTFAPRMNSLPHFELFSMCLDHLLRWVADGVVPPRADRLEVGPDDWFVADEVGNTRGGVRCVQMDVPHSTYHANPVGPDGRPTRHTVGTEQPFDEATLRARYGSVSSYRERFARRLDELVDAGWFLAHDADVARREAEAVTF